MIEPGVILIGELYLFVSGPDQVFALNTNPGLTGYAKRLTAAEVESLPESIIYTGEREEFSTDHKEAFRWLGSLIFDMNQMQEAQVYSFPLASFLAHLMGNLYTQIMDKYEKEAFITCIVASGSGNTSRTGKSLMTSMMQLVFDGCKSKEKPIAITESAVFEKLGKGTALYSKYTIFLFTYLGAVYCAISKKFNQY